ncbi:sphingolipid 4-desaturase [Acrasis kona]|uniref:sphingolipid 4-desaturase n=1 Tax=Acrasis kona TaxID=1008807 RepID=A0AAW2Z7W1_9EUKA
MDSQASSSTQHVVSGQRNDFFWDNQDEPHLRRKYAMLKAHPQIKQLFGPDPNTKYKLFSFVAIQLFTCYVVTKYVNTWWLYLLIAYCIGGTFNHSCSISIHEATHNLIFEKQLYNTLIAIFVNLPLTLPAAMSFKRYHHEHHLYLGVDVLDVDVATKIEAETLRSPLRKLFFITFMSLFYAIRPLLTYPKKPSAWEVFNTLVQISFDVVIFYLGGFKALGYLFLSTLLGLGLHPTSGHFIQEHFIFKEGQETYSYYGPLNLVMLNVGYHNEHHDFPRIAGSRLPQLRKIAPEFYNNLKYHTSWVRVLYDYIFCNDINMFNRIKRTKNVHDIARKRGSMMGRQEHDCYGNVDGEQSVKKE